MDEHNHKVTLLDEDGNEIEFELVVTLDVGENTYAILAQENGEDAFPCRVEEEADGKSALIPVESEEEFAAVAAAYDEIDFGDEEE